MAELKIFIFWLFACILLQNVQFSKEAPCINVDNIGNNERTLFLQFTAQVKPEEAGPFQKLGNSYYLIETEQEVNWFKAAHICSSHKAALVSIESAYELNALSNYLIGAGHASKQFWTSGNDLDVDDLYQWLGTGNTFTYTKWYNGKPDNGTDEHCIYIKTGNQSSFQFNDRVCKYNLKYICEKN